MKNQLLTIKDYYNNKNDNRDPWYRFKKVLNIINQKTRSSKIQLRVLDLGCQMGQLIKLLPRLNVVNVVGIDDYDPENLFEIAKIHFDIDIKNINEVFDGSWEYVQRRLDETGISLNVKFDIITALEIIEHMIDTDFFINDCKRHLKENGIIVISTPNINSLRNRILVPLGIYPAGIEYKNIIHHVRIYNINTLISHFKEHGFHPIKIIGVNFLPESLLKYSFARLIDSFMTSALPSFCGNIIIAFSTTSKETLQESH